MKKSLYFALFLLLVGQIQSADSDFVDVCQEFVDQETLWIGRILTLIKMGKIFSLLNLYKDGGDLQISLNDVTAINTNLLYQFSTLSSVDQAAYCQKFKEYMDVYCARHQQRTMREAYPLSQREITIFLSMTPRYREDILKKMESDPLSIIDTSYGLYENRFEQLQLAHKYSVVSSRSFR